MLGYGLWYAFSYLGCCFICLYEPCHQLFRRKKRAQRDARIRSRREQEGTASRGVNSEGYNQLAETARSNIFDDNIFPVPREAE